MPPPPTILTQPGDYNAGPLRESVPLPDGVDSWSLLQVRVEDQPNPPMIQPGLEVATPGEGILVDVEVKDRLLMELKRRLFPTDVEGILYSAMTGDLYWQDQLFQLMIDTWPRLQTNLLKLKRAVSSIEYGWVPYKGTKQETPSAIEKAEVCQRAITEMTTQIAFQEHDFRESLEDIVEAIPTGFVISEIYWEVRNGEICPRCTRRIPARYYRYPYVIEATDRLMLNPSGTLGGTDLYDFPPYKFLLGIKHTSVHHPVFSIMLRCLAAWWVASRFGLEWFMNYAQLFGIPYRMAKYDTSDNLVYQKLVQMMRQAGSASWGVFPSGTEVEILTAAGATGNMPQERLLEYADRVCDILLLGQTLTTEVGQSGSRALGGVHKEVLDEITTAAALWVSKVVNTQLIPGIVKYNFGTKEPLELPMMVPVIKSPIDLLQTAQAIQILGQQMRVPLKKSELYRRIEFSPPTADDELYEPPEISALPPVPGFRSRKATQITPASEAGGEEGRTPGTTDSPKDQMAPDKGPGTHDAMADNSDSELTSVNGWRKVSFALDYGEEPDPGEIMRFVEGQRKFPTEDPEWKGMAAGVEIQKKNVDMKDEKVCKVCKAASKEGWIAINELFGDEKPAAPHHPNCRCTTNYRARTTIGVDIYHDTKSGNPRHHPKTGRFV